MDSAAKNLIITAAVYVMSSVNGSSSLSASQKALVLMTRQRLPQPTRSYVATVEVVLEQRSSSWLAIPTWLQFRMS